MNLTDNTSCNDNNRTSDNINSNNNMPNYHHNQPLTPSSALFGNLNNSPVTNITSHTSTNNLHNNIKNGNHISHVTYNTDNTTATLFDNKDNQPKIEINEVNDDIKSTSTTNTNTNTNTNNNSNNGSDPSIEIDNSLSSSPYSVLTNSSRRFSFNKRPVSKSKKIGRKSSQISIIHNYPPQMCDSVDHDMDHSKFYNKYKGILKDKDELPDNALNDLSFEYNYDEKIRAPRMSVASLLSTTTSNNNHLKIQRQTSAPALMKTYSNTSSHNTLDSLAEEEPNDTTHTNIHHHHQKSQNFVKKSENYHPASYDLTQKLRKFSLNDSNPELPNNDSNIINNSNNHNNNNNIGIFNDNTGQYTYKIQERKKSVISNNSSTISPTRENFLKISNDDLKPIKQIDEPLKLLDNYVPPVLRPIQDSTFKFQKEVEKDKIIDTKKTSSHSTIPTTDDNDNNSSNSPSSSYKDTRSTKLQPSITPPTSKEYASSLSMTQSKVHNKILCQLNNNNNINNNTNNDNINTLSPVNSKLSINEQLSLLSSPNKNSSVNDYSFFNKNNKNCTEPSHSHWKPNSATNFCENCQSNFNIIKRKHHCRHCGGIFCSKCLQNFANLNILAHFEKPDNIPATLNLNNLSKNFLVNNLIPIKSTDTVETCNTIYSNNTNKTVDTNNYKNSDEKNYSSYCKVCPNCYSQWLFFLASNEEYEGKNSNLQDLEDNQTNLRKESISGVPSDWNWSSF